MRSALTVLILTAMLAAAATSAGCGRSRLSSPSSSAETTKITVKQADVPFAVHPAKSR